MVKATNSRLDIPQSCSGHTSHWVKDVEFESVFAVRALVFALKITHSPVVVLCIYATAVIGNNLLYFTPPFEQKNSNESLYCYLSSLIF